MNRRQKIIVSVTGIFIVLLILVGLTYGYFLTKITGNNNDKSISVSTANLELVYGNDNGNVIGDGEIIVPNTTFDAKTFTVTNEGNADTDYVVVIENATNNFKYNDFVYTLSCTSDGEPCTGVDTETTYPINGGILVANTIEVGKTHTYSFTLKYVDTGSDQSDDMNKTLTGRINISVPNEFNPYRENKNTLAYNIISNAKNKTNGTELLMTSKSKIVEEPSLYNGNVPVENVSYDWQYSDSISTIAMGNGTPVSKCSNDLIGKYLKDNVGYFYGKTELITVAGCDGDISMYSTKVSEKTLSITSDDYGMSYYYRGTPNDNYVEFNNMCWRIVRIEGDGSIKLVLSSQNKCSEKTSNGIIETVYYGSSSNGTFTKADYVNGGTSDDYNDYKTLKVSLEDWLINSGIDKTKLKQDNWCLGNLTVSYSSAGKLLNETRESLLSNSTTYYSAAAVRLGGLGTTPYATLKCNGKNEEKYSSYIGTLTADEVIFAGSVDVNKNNNYDEIPTFTYLSENDNKAFFTLSISGANGIIEDVFYVTDSVFLSSIHSVQLAGARPSIVLKSNTTISNGSGTITDPYIIE